MILAVELAASNWTDYHMPASGRWREACMLHHACLRTQGGMVSSEYGHDCLSIRSNDSSFRFGTECGLAFS